jgi:hypothetical protein
VVGVSAAIAVVGVSAAIAVVAVLLTVVGVAAVSPPQAANILVSSINTNAIEIVRRKFRIFAISSSSWLSIARHSILSLAR